MICKMKWEHILYLARLRVLKWTTHKIQHSTDTHEAPSTQLFLSVQFVSYTHVYNTTNYIKNLAPIFEHHPFIWLGEEEWNIHSHTQIGREPVLFFIVNSKTILYSHLSLSLSLLTSFICAVHSIFGGIIFAPFTDFMALTKITVKKKTKKEI